MQKKKHHNNKFTTYKQKKKYIFEFTSVSSNFSGGSQKIGKIFVNDNFNNLQLDAILNHVS